MIHRYQEDQRVTFSARGMRPRQWTKEVPLPLHPVEQLDSKPIPNLDT